LEIKLETTLKKKFLCRKELAEARKLDKTMPDSVCHSCTNEGVHRGVDKSLAFPISPMGGCGTTKRIFLGWVKEVRTTKS
jgi:hypothetical protein